MSHGPTLSHWRAAARRPLPAMRRGRQAGRVQRSLLVALAATVAGVVVALEAMRADSGAVWWEVTAIIALVAIAAGGVTYYHISRIAFLRQEFMRELSSRFDELDNHALGNSVMPSSPPPGLYQRIETAARQAKLFRDISEGVHGVEALFDPDCRLLWISPSIERLTGRSPRDLLAADDALKILVDDSDLSFCRRTARKIVQGSGAEDFEIRLLNIDGQVRWVASHWRPIYEEGGAIRMLRMSAEDIQARKETEYKLLETVAEVRRSDALREHYLSRSNDERMRLAALLNVIRLGILFMDHDNRVLYFNRAALDIWRFAKGENLIGVRDAILRSHITHMLEAPDAYFERVAEILADNRDSEPEEVHFRDGRIVTYVSAFVRGDSGQRNIGRVWIYEDVTEQRRTAASLVQLAEHDPLTNLFNRRRFHADLKRLLADAERRRYMVGLIMIDLDGFKPINDRFGHQAGDEVLVTMTAQVGKLIRRNETFFRLGGDEFCVLVPGVNEQGLEDLAQRISNGVASLTFHFNGQDVSLTASLGMAIYPLHVEDGEALVAAADHAMYEAKNGGRNCCIMAQRLPEAVKIASLSDIICNHTEDQ